METNVRLDRLPEGLEFPAPFSERIRFDAQRRQLVYRGFMSKYSFDALCKLSNEDEYRRALEDLFRHATPAAHHSSSESHWRRYVAVATVGALAVCGLGAVTVLLFRGA